jgi:hypothetical protein
VGKILPKMAQGGSVRDERMIPTVTPVAPPGNCEHCGHWHPISVEQARILGAVPPAGECHGGHPTFPGVARWPVTRADDDCGDFQAKVP